MGLDITSYESATRLRDNRDDDDCDYTTEVPIYINGDFPKQADDLTDGVYSTSGSSHFYAGGYMGYGRWREQLAKLAGYPAHVSTDPFDRVMPHSASLRNGSITTGPFYELINFSDCEGVIGPKTAAKLAGDFAAFQDRVPVGDDRFSELYSSWRKAFESAAKGGLVRFS